jgi:hypothetical protein
LVFAKDVNILGGRVHTIQKNTEVIVVAVKKSGPDVNSEKTHVDIFRAAGVKKLQHKAGNKSFGKLGRFRYWNNPNTA